MPQKVLVIGGGIVGAMTAWRLQSAGVQVTLITGMGPSATEGSLAWLNVSSTVDPPYASLRLRALKDWERLAGQGAPVALPGTFLWGEQRGDPAERVAVLNDMGMKARVVGSAEILDLAPGMAAPPNGFFLEGEGYANPRGIVPWLYARCRDAGARLERLDALRIMERGGAATGALLDDGTSLEADAVVLTAGTGTNALLEGFDLEIQTLLSPAMTLKTQPAARVMLPVLAGPDGDMWQGSDGTIWAAIDTSGLDCASVDRGQSQIEDRIRKHFPDLKFSTAKAVARHRPMPFDKRPMVGRVPGVEGLSLAYTHSGMTLAPVLAEQLVAEVLGKATVAEADPYGPDRGLRTIRECETP